MEVGNAGNSPRVVTLKQYPMVETMTKVRMIGVSQNVGKIDMLRRGNWKIRKEEMRMNRLLCTAGSTEGGEATKCMEVRGITILEAQEVSMQRPFIEGILDQALWVQEDLQSQWSMGGICHCDLLTEDFHDPSEGWWHLED